MQHAHDLATSRVADMDKLGQCLKSSVCTESVCVVLCVHRVNAFVPLVVVLLKPPLSVCHAALHHTEQLACEASRLEAEHSLLQWAACGASGEKVEILCPSETRAAARFAMQAVSNERHGQQGSKHATELLTTVCWNGMLTSAISCRGSRKDSS